MANILSKIFKKREKKEVQRIEVLNGRPQSFSYFNGDAYSSDIYRSAVDSIARNVAKLKGMHIIRNEKSRSKGDSSLNYILQVRPNPFMTAYDLIYKLCTHYYLYNNAFAYLDKDDKGNLIGIYPLKPLYMEFMVDPSNDLYCKFVFNGNKESIFPFNDVLILRRFFNDNDLLGDDNQAILPTLNLAHTQSEGMENNIKSGGQIRGILKYTQTLAPEKLKQEKEIFVKDYMSMADGGGIIAVDGKYEYIPVDLKPTLIDEKQLQAIKNKIYEYLGISENIVNSTYTESEWSSFYESVVEPLGVQLGLELTDKVFTRREQRFGNTIIFEANRLEFASINSKTSMIKELIQFGLLSINDARDILNLPPVEDGDRRVQTLNVVDIDLVNDYQIGKKELSNNEGNKNEWY